MSKAHRDNSTSHVVIAADNEEDSFTLYNANSMKLVKDLESLLPLIGKSMTLL